MFATTNADEEWEYEYDENETEDFYIPIDLSNVPSAHIPMNSDRRPGHPTLLKSRLRALNATRGQVPEAQLDAINAQDPTTMGELQLTGLHTSNPLIMHNGQLLSCHWASTVGTDMFFTKPQTAEGDSPPALRSLPSVDLLSLGTAKLVARVGRLRPRDDLFENEPEDMTHASTQDVDEAVKDQEESSIPSEQDKDNRPTSATSTATSSSFLAKLNEVKARRGENSRLSATRTPEGSRLISESVDLNIRSEEVDSSHGIGDVAMGGT
ncbi:hypothetical protein DE146DRAFT_138969 [Phaeosphaeria sp. MPI-PUGE-AT-0046c]|nr:hypothetical protein DE146DRAFT_138969 [Phaeosphaeria sp. MPI-PUGE-AT-0046c]